MLITAFLIRTYNADKKIIYDNPKQIRTATQLPTNIAKIPSTNNIPDNNKNISASRDGIGKNNYLLCCLRKIPATYRTKVTNSTVL